MMIFLSAHSKNKKQPASYAASMGIGMVGSVIFGGIFLKGPFNLVKVVSLLLIISGILGLKLSSVT